MSFLKCVVLPMMIAYLVGFSLIMTFAWYGFFDHLSAVESGITGLVSGCVGIVSGFFVAYQLDKIEIREGINSLYDRIIAHLFGHRHRWRNYKMIGNEGYTYFYCRECECGADQMQNAGPMGDGKWKDKSIPSRFSWERDWIANARRVEE